MRLCFFQNSKTKITLSLLRNNLILHEKILVKYNITLLLGREKHHSIFGFLSDNNGLSMPQDNWSALGMDDLSHYALTNESDIWYLVNGYLRCRYRSNVNFCWWPLLAKISRLSFMVEWTFVSVDWHLWHSWDCVPTPKLFRIFSSIQLWNLNFDIRLLN